MIEWVEMVQVFRAVLSAAVEHFSVGLLSGSYSLAPTSWWYWVGVPPDSNSLDLGLVFLEFVAAPVLE